MIGGRRSGSTFAAWQLFLRGRLRRLCRRPLLGRRRCRTEGVRAVIWNRHHPRSRRRHGLGRQGRRASHGGRQFQWFRGATGWFGVRSRRVTVATVSAARPDARAPWPALRSGMSAARAAAANSTVFKRDLHRRLGRHFGVGLIHGALHRRQGRQRFARQRDRRGQVRPDRRRRRADNRRRRCARPSSPTANWCTDPDWRADRTLATRPWSARCRLRRIGRRRDRIGNGARRRGRRRFRRSALPTTAPIRRLRRGSNLCL